MFMFWVKFLWRSIATYAAGSFCAGVIATISIQRKYFADDPLPSSPVFYLFLVISAICFIFTLLQLKDARDESERLHLTAARQIAERKAQSTNEANPHQPCDGKGLPAVVCRLRREGKDEKEIAEYLSDKGQWCSNPQVGALLHENTAISGVTADTMTKYAQRLLNKA